jgi:TRIAD3 protein (E3 ubiquitin-protein ligase RNF216)
VDFPYIPKPHVRKTFFTDNALYAPTHLFLAEESRRRNHYHTSPRLPHRASPVKAKQDLEFNKEEWPLLNLQGAVTLNDFQVAEEMNEQEYEDCGDGFECGCCFSTYPFICLSLSIHCHNSTDTIIVFRTK